MRVIFLDIDGVLNSEQYDKKTSDLPYPLNAIDPSALELLNQLVEETQAKVVISSDWRAHNTLDGLRAIFSELGFRGEILDTTPVFHFRDRLGEIKRWVSEAIIDRGMLIHHFVILDDETLNVRPAVSVDPLTGLTKENIEQAKTILHVLN